MSVSVCKEHKPTQLNTYINTDKCHEIIYYYIYTRSLPNIVMLTLNGKQWNFFMPHRPTQLNVVCVLIFPYNQYSIQPNHLGHNKETDFI